MSIQNPWINDKDKVVRIVQINITEVNQKFLPLTLVCTLWTRNVPPCPLLLCITYFYLLAKKKPIQKLYSKEIFSNILQTSWVFLCWCKYHSDLKLRIIFGNFMVKYKTVSSLYVVCRCLKYLSVIFLWKSINHTKIAKKSAKIDR